MPFCQHVITTMVTVYGTMIMGILVPDVQTVLAIIGTTMGTVICFICPSVFHAKLRKDTFTGRIVLGFGILLLLIRASSITDLNGEELQLQPIRKSRVTDESGNAKIALRNGGSELPTPGWLYHCPAQRELDRHLDAANRGTDPLALRCTDQ
ncbi:putative sodium-coupled neutral amino acid transporter 10 [Hemiscyllium ocellatum]|uniref:putative sodium-coupled neutral amino acid transporter 10 n=1 Tax=Hemiscyllium ocellatum TaxID=170820 RepID=UPI0029664A5F|nr:putative sodium-coupled neutral amino acid transporter 10 [Hemiscyllium ocellatum]